MSDKNSNPFHDDAPVDFAFDKMLKTFIKKVKTEGKLEELRTRKFYVKPSEIKRKLENERRRKNEMGKNDRRRRNT